MTSFRLECGACARTSDPTPLATLCPDCGSPQLVRYSIVEDGANSNLREIWAARSDRMWRFRELLPLLPGEAPVSLGEGGTPLVRLEKAGEALGLNLLLKDEGGNPTGSFKDRGLSVAVTRAVHDGASSFVLPSAGNAGVALAAYAARAGVTATIFMPEDTPTAVFERCRVYGADVVAVAGLISDCGIRAARHAEETGAFDMATLREPYRIEGKKTMGLEILADLGWRAPDAIIYPAGGGTGLIGTWKAIQEARALNMIERPLTRMYVVQAAGCAPIVRAWESGANKAEVWLNADTEAWGLRVPTARGDALMLGVLRESDGGAVAVEDRDMRTAASNLAESDGLAIGIEGGATMAAAAALRDRGDLAPGETVVLFNTGNLTNYGWYTG